MVLNYITVLVETKYTFKLGSRSIVAQATQYAQFAQRVVYMHEISGAKTSKALTAKHNRSSQDYVTSSSDLIGQWPMPVGKMNVKCSHQSPSLVARLSCDGDVTVLQNQAKTIGGSTPDQLFLWW